MLGLICLLFLLCSLGSGLLISAFCHTQTQAIQFAVFYLLPVFPLSGAFAPIRAAARRRPSRLKRFPLTHFCEAFRMVNLRNADFSFYAAISFSSRRRDSHLRRRRVDPQPDGRLKHEVPSATMRATAASVFASQISPEAIIARISCTEMRGSR